MREKWRAILLPFENNGLWETFSWWGPKVFPARTGVCKVNGFIFQDVVRR